MKTLDLFLIIILIAMIFIGVLAYLMIKTDSVSCMAGPIPYGIQKLESSVNEKIICSCSARNIQPIYITSQGIAKLPD